MKLLKSILTILLCTAVLLFSVFLIGRYGWKLLGFHTCESSRCENALTAYYLFRDEDGVYFDTAKAFDHIQIQPEGAVAIP